VREVYRWARAKELTLNLKKCEVSFFSPDPHEAKWKPVVVVEGMELAFNPRPKFLGVELGRLLSGKEQADSRAASPTKGSRVLMALSGSDWGWPSNLLRKVYQTSLLSRALYAGGGWLPWLSATSVESLDRTQNRNLRFNTGQLASTPTDALRVETRFQSFGCLRDRAAAAALERSLRLDPATHPRAKQADLRVTQRFKRGADGRSLGKEVVGRVGGGLDTLGRLPLPPPTSAPWEWGRGSWTVSLSLRGGSSPDHPPARKLADALDTIWRYDQLWTVIYTDGSAVGGVKRGGSSAVVTSGDPGNPTFLDVRHQFGPEHTTSLEVEMWGIWLALDCLDNETAAAGVLICSDSQ
jgi:hypothetical protein